MARVLASLHVADLGPGGTTRAVLRKLRPDDVAGLRWGTTALVTPLAFDPPPPVQRAAVFAFWDDEDSIDRFLADDRTGQRFAEGFHARLTPLRRFGSWEGLPEAVPTTRAVAHDGPVVVFTLGWLRMSQLPRFLKTSRPAEEAANASEGMVWGSAAVRPPFVATASIWADSKSAAGYAYGKQRPAHSHAIAEQQRKDFHKRSAFIRFAPMRMEGSLNGPNPLDAGH